jgi:hypothetical protein
MIEFEFFCVRDASGKPFANLKFDTCFMNGKSLKRQPDGAFLIEWIRSTDAPERPINF